MPKNKKQRRLVSIQCKSCDDPVMCFATDKKTELWNVCPSCTPKITRAAGYAVSLRAAMLSSDVQFAAEQLASTDADEALTRLDEVRDGLEALSRDAAVFGWRY